ncbi:hypothetical protein [Peijinzhouia sedimentorum]
MRVLYLIIAVILFSFAPTNEMLVITEKQIKVSGVTSIGKFTCDYCIDDMKDTLISNRTNRSGTLQFTIPVDDFSCGNFMLNKDFRKTLKSDEYPSAKVQVSNLVKKENGYFCHLRLQIVGKELIFENFHLTKSDQKLTGKLTLSFDELELKAPKKLGGLIKVDETLHLQIELGT